jgi:hypothetical protein
VKELSNNWVFPFPDRAYDPKLKVCIRYWSGWGPEPEMDSARFAILSVPRLIEGTYSEPLSSSDQEEIAKYGVSRQEVDKSVPIDTYKSFNIVDSRTSLGLFEAHRKIIGPLLRVYLFRSSIATSKDPDGLWYLKRQIEKIKSRNSGLLKSNTEDFLVYAFKNLIKMKSVILEFGENTPSPPILGISQVDICMHASAMTNVFHLQCEEYQEVEVGWHQLASRDVNS